MTYGKDNLPEFLEFLQEEFDNLQTLGVSAKGANLWAVKQGDIVLKGERESSPTTDIGGRVTTRLRLGGQAWDQPTGKVRSTEKNVTAKAESNNVADIQAAVTESLEEFASNGETLYEAWVNTFGEETIQKDSRKPL